MAEDTTVQSCRYDDRSNSLSNYCGTRRQGGKGAKLGLDKVNADAAAAAASAAAHCCADQPDKFRFT